jgi:hypothetical protein
MKAVHHIVTLNTLNQLVLALFVYTLGRKLN